MFTFKEYYEIDNILNEAFSSDNSKNNNEWIEAKDFPNHKFHDTKIGNDRITIMSKVSDNDTNRVHTISFHVNGDHNKQTIDPINGKHILTHIAKAIHGYAANHVKKGDMIVMSALDKNDSVKNKKDSVYQMFGKRLAKHIGGRYQNRSMHTSQLHFIYK